MRQVDAELSVEWRTVVVFDICSSTTMLERLISRQNLQPWRNLLMSLQQFMDEERRLAGYEIYKFIGDGWILLFPDSVTGASLMGCLDRLATFYKAKVEDVVLYLDRRPPVMGLTFGVDYGELVRLEMKGAVEYVGRAINVAARLQGAFKADPSPGYKVLFSKPAYNWLSIPTSWASSNEAYPLRNVQSGELCDCVKVQLRAAREIVTTGADPAKPHQRKVQIEKDCPSCGAVVRYWQKTKKDSAVAVRCTNTECPERSLYSREANGEFILRIRRPVPEKLECPNCRTEIMVDVDPLPGSVTGPLGNAKDAPHRNPPASLIRKLGCSNCGKDLVAIRGSSKVQLRLLHPDENQRLDEEFLKKVKDTMGPQPWPRRQVTEAAARLGVHRRIVSQAVRVLVGTGVFKHQLRDRLYDRAFDEGFLKKVEDALGPRPWPKGHAGTVAARLGLPKKSVRHAVQELFRRGAFKDHPYAS